MVKRPPTVSTQPNSTSHWEITVAFGASIVASIGVTLVPRPLRSISAAAAKTFFTFLRACSLGGKGDAVEVAVFDLVAVHQHNMADTKAHELLDHRAPRAGGADDADPQLLQAPRRAIAEGLVLGRGKGRILGGTYMAHQNFRSGPMTLIRSRSVMPGSRQW